MARRVTLTLALLLASITLVACLAAAEVPTPESVIGFRPGTDCKLADWDAITRYFRELDRTSGRVGLEVIGKSTMGRDMLLAVISSEENVARLSGIKDALGRLADPRGLTEAEARRLIDGTPAALFVGCAQHATEIASTQMAMLLAHRLAAEESPAMDYIRSNVVLLLVPSMNPDGHQMVCDWYNEHLGTPYEGSRMPWLYHEYVGHDNNRDWAMITQAETLHISRVLYEEWFPQIVIDVHQMGNRGARMFIPPYYDPVNPNIDPLIGHELALLSAQMRLDMSAAGHKGIITNAMFDEWLLGYFTSVPSRHNMVTELIEMASVNVASPVFSRQRDLSTSRGSDEYGRRANFPEPWEGGWWRLGDITAYEETALLSALGLAARSRELFLENFYTLGARQIEKGRSEPPFAFLVPRGQNDPATAWKLVDALQKGGAEVHRARADFAADDIDYPAGTWVVLMAQPYRAHAKDLLEKQVYPNLRTYPGGPPERPYDVAGWTYPLQMGVKAVEVVNPFDAELEIVARSDSPPPGAIEALEGGGGCVLVERSQNNAFVLINRLLAAGAAVKTMVEIGDDTIAGGRKFPLGTFVIGSEDGLPDGIGDMIEELGLRAFSVGAPPPARLADVEPVRLGLYQPWTASMDEGWTRWVLEQFEFPFRSVHDAEVRAGGLIDRYDAIILPDSRADSIINGNSKGSVPAKYAGGIGEEGVFALRDFARAGGTLIALDSSCSLLIDKLELPVKNAQVVPPRRWSYDSAASTRPEQDTKRFFCPGSILRINVDNTHSLGWGLPPAVAIVNSNSPAFERVEAKGKGDREAPGRDEDSPAAAVFVGTYPGVNPLMSGWIENDEIIRGKGALVEAGFEKGKAVLIGFRCQFRAQSHGTFKVLFNAILSARYKQGDDS